MRAVSWIVNAAAAIGIMLALDAVWLAFQRGTYANLVQSVQRAPLRSFNIWAAVVAYALMAVGLVAFVLPNVARSPEKDKLWPSLRYGGLYGLTVYGIYDATNMAIFRAYPLPTALLDVAWGTLLFTLTPYLASLVAPTTGTPFGSRSADATAMSAS